MKLRPVLLVIAASACLAAKPASAADVSYAQTTGDLAANHAATVGSAHDDWAQGAESVPNASSSFADLSGFGDAGGPFALTVGDAGIESGSTDSAPNTAPANKPKAKKATPYTFRYEHKHKTHAKTTIEKLELGRQLGHGFSVSVAQEWLPKAKADKSAGDAFHSLEAYKTRLDINYSRKAGDTITFKHRFRNDFKDSKRETKARFQLQMKLQDNLSITPGYERKNVYSKTGKPNAYFNIASVVVEYKWKKFKSKYTREYIHATSGIVYNNRKTDYKNKYVIAYSSKQFEPYLEVRNSSWSSTGPGREDDIRLGVKYRF